MCELRACPAGPASPSVVLRAAGAKEHDTELGSGENSACGPGLPIAGDHCLALPGAGPLLLPVHLSGARQDHLGLAWVSERRAGTLPGVTALGKAVARSLDAAATCRARAGHLLRFHVAC